jgi:hypothetical protein
MYSFTTSCRAALLGLGLSGTLLLSACNDRLNIAPEAHNSVADFYKTESDFNQGVIGIYNKFLVIPGDSYWNMSTLRSDDFVVTVGLNTQRDYADINGFSATSQTGQLEATWSDYYSVIYRANVVLGRLPSMSFARAQQFTAEARFLRALAYFDLVRYWGAVPLTTTEVTIAEAKSLPRSPTTDVYQLITDDLTFAAANLPDAYASTDKGRVTKWAAKALLGKVYLTMYGYPLKQADKLTLAKQQFADVLAQEGVSASVPALAPSYKSMFQTTNDNRYWLFEIQYISGTGGLGGTAASDQAFQFPSQWSGYQPVGPDGGVNPNLLGAGWPKIDARKAATLDSGYVDTKTKFISPRIQYTKFLEKGTTAPTSRSDYPNNFPVIRLEDVLLMQAEVLNEGVAAGASAPTQALTYLNRIRTRAGVPVLKTMTKEAFKLAVEQERRWEFAAEGLRWFDLVRTGRALTVMNQFIKDNGVRHPSPLDEHDLLFPVPLQEMQINPGFWQQNPGYN